MVDVREVIVAAIPCNIVFGRQQAADGIISALHTAGFRILDSDEVSALADTRKALAALDRMNRGLDWCDHDEQARRWSAARRVLEAQGGENG